MKKHFLAAVSLLLIMCVLFLTGCNNVETETPVATSDSIEETLEDEEISSETEEEATLPETESTDINVTIPSAVPSTKPSKPSKVPAPVVTVPATVPAPVKKDVDSYKWNPAGVYEVGTGKNMLVPGEYYILNTGSKAGSVSLVNKKIGRYVEHSYLITLNAGDKVYIEGCKIINASVERPHAEGGKYLPGIYKVGRDIPAGEYVFRITNKNKAPGNYGFTTLNSTVLYGGGEIYTLVKSFGYLTLKEGQYIKLYGCTLENKSDKPIYDKGSKDYYPQGMYLVGKDLPAGEYIARGTAKTCALEYHKDSLHSMSSSIKSVDIKENTTVVVNLVAGQYVVADNVTLTKRPSLG